jgi:hypothetical protein
MEKFVKIYDDLITAGLVNTVEDFILNSGKLDFLYFNNATGGYPKTHNPCFNHTFTFKDNPQSVQSKFFNQILHHFCHSQRLVPKHILQGRVWLTMPSPNPKPFKVHIDIEDIDHLVCLYYVNDSDGDTILYEEDKKTEMKRISPKKGRILFFNGSIPHCSSEPSKKERAVINFDFLL